MVAQTETDRTLRAAIVDIDGSLLDVAANPVSISGQVTRHGLGTWQVQLDASDPVNAWAQQKGARCVFTYRGQPLDSGMIRTNGGSLLPGGLTSFQVQSDWRILQNTLALVAPANPVAPAAVGDLAQAVQTGTAGASGTVTGQTGYYVFPAGVSSAEAAIKQVLTDNLVTRLNRPVTIAPNQDRGGDARAAGMLPMVRMADLATAVSDLLTWSGLTLTVVQAEGSGLLTIETSQPTGFAAALTVESGIVSDGTWSLSAPSATRALVGGPGEDAARAFWQVNDATGLEADWGDVVEVFKDATGATLKWPSSLSSDYQVAKYYLLRSEVAQADKDTFRNYLTAAGLGALTDGLPTSGVNATLSEQGDFYFGGANGVQLGTPVRIKAAGVPTVRDVITGAKFSLTRSDGLVVEPIVGNVTDDPDVKVARAIRALAAAQVRISRER